MNEDEYENRLMDDFVNSMKDLDRRFRRARRNQVTIAFIVSFLMWFFFAGFNLITSLIVGFVVAIGRWFFFTRKIT